MCIFYLFIYKYFEFIDNHMCFVFIYCCLHLLAKILVESLTEAGWLFKTCDLLYRCNIYFYHS